jgi:hypothetical protein
MEAKWSGLGLIVFVLAVVFVLGSSGFTTATGSGYNQSYSQSAGHSSVPGVDLIDASSTYSSGPNLTISFTVSGTISYANSTDQGYIVWFGGSSYENATAYAVFANQSSIWLSSTPSGEGTLTPQVSGGTLSFSMATAELPSPSSFTFNVFAYHGFTQTTGQYSWLGTNYNGGGTCTGTTCTTTSSGSSFDWWIIIIPVIVVVVIVVIVVILVMRKKPPTQPAMMGQPAQPMDPMGTPTSAPPAGQTNWQTPPPPPPAGVQ